MEATRRNFVKAAGVAAAVAGAGIAGIANASEKADAPTASAAADDGGLKLIGGGTAKKFEFDETADVIVVGGGNAGQGVARTVTEAGLSCIVIEALEPEVGPYVDKPLPSNASYRTEGALTMSGTGRDDQPNYGPEQHLEGIELQTGEDGPIDLLRNICEHSGEVYRLLTELGIDFRVVTTNKDNEPTTFVNDKMGAGILEVLSDAAESQGSKTEYGIRARHLVTNADGRVIGVIAEDAGENTIAYGAKYGVVLACGGWLNSKDLLKNLGNLKHEDLQYCNAGSLEQGDGFLMGMELGAATWFVGIGHEAHGLMARDRIRFFPGSADDLAPVKDLIMGAPLVNLNGERFIAESAQQASEICPAILMQPKGYSYNIYNDEMREAMGDSEAGGINFGPVTPDVPHYNGDTIEELAANIAAGEDGFDADKFIETMNNYIAYEDDGNDPDFNRTFADNRISLSQGRYYCTVTCAGSIVPGGGLRVDSDCRVLHNPDLEPIPGLYASGGTLGIRGTDGAAKGFNCVKGLSTGLIVGRDILDEAGVDWSKYVR